LYKLKKLELLGFKSFAERTRLEFADAMAAIVGPNGCGKSNLSDAITWVLGEQSARLLRGERMADVIFNGTGLRPATGMAEVSMTLIDPEYSEAGILEDEPPPESAPSDSPLPEFDAAAPQPTGNGNGNGSESSGSPSVDSLPAQATARPSKIQHRAGEITVTRRLFRSGESEYLINGEISRLRDIQDIFMGTGLGPESYAIIEQGRIGQVLSSKPSDRRLILEEAAGVSKFKTRKRLAEAKLESSRQNLARITDILEEVTKQVNSLKRQASKARRYKEIQAELRGRLKVALLSRWMVLDAECQRLRAELVQAQEACAAAARELESLEHEQKAAALRHEESEDQLRQVRERVAAGELERERAQSRREQVRQESAHLDARAAEARRESAELENQRAALEQQTADHTREQEQLRRDCAAAQEALSQLLARQEALSAQLGAAESEVEACRLAVLQAVSRVGDLRNQLVQAEEVGLSLERQLSRTEAEKSRVEQEQERLSAELQDSIAEQRRGENALRELAESAQRATAELERARADEASQRSQLETLRQEYSGAAARRQALEESLARHAYSTESVRRLLSSEIATNGQRLRPLGLLADFVEVSPGYEEVVEEFLKEELECVVVEKHEHARSGIELLRSEGGGRSTFYVTRMPSNGHTNGHGDAALRRERGVVAPVCELVQFSKALGLNGEVALPALANAYVVEDGMTAERLAGAYPECHFLTRRGEHYHFRFVSGGKGPSAGPLALRREFRELERRTGELEAAMQSSEVALAEAGAHATKIEEERQRLTAAKLEGEKKIVVANEKLRQTREACERVREQVQTLRSERATLAQEHAAVRERLDGLRLESEAALRERTRHEEGLTRETQKLRELRVELDRLAQELVEAQARASTLEERTHAAEAASARLHDQLLDIRNRLERLAQQAESWREEQGRLALENTSLGARLQELEAESASAREELFRLEQECQAMKAQRDELSPQVERARAALEALREKRSQTEVALARADSDHHHHAQQCRDELQAAPEALRAEVPAESALSGEALEAAEEEVRQMKVRLENLGPVNMMALEELQEAEERFNFLETQRQDLLLSIEDTAQAIREIDQVSRQQFLEAFQAINIYFAESFQTLFGGGLGQMRLSDEADPDSGIDIVAQPPGKRLQNVLLLSGGEKAMAALALLIAIFRYTPSPFCVLDEVDAPLDESNIARFTRMIQQMSRHTQFILITHNKRTMEIARVMYGVTMEEPGVSKLVSVRFDAATQEPAAVPA
jgi:chromosome segregation protein